MEQASGQDRRALYTSLMSAHLFLRGPVEQPPAVTDPETGRRAVPVFFTEASARAFWQLVAPGTQVELVRSPFSPLAETGRRVGALVVEPSGENFVLDRGGLLQLSHGEIPGEFAAWLREPGRLGRAGSEVLARLRRSHVHVIAGKDAHGEPRLYLLEKSEDGTPAVACFSSAESLAQFAQVRRLFEGHHDYAVALIEGEQCIRAAGGMGAYLLIDPESPWETLIEPTLS